MTDPGAAPDTPTSPGRKPRRAADFFVAGGPVAPDRPCYISRSTDTELLERVAAGEHCHIIAPRLSGKSSLAASASISLRAEGSLAAVIDLSQLGGREGSGEAGRWYYGLAYRVLRDLRLKLDLQSWWQERMPLPPAQRLGEFFWELVLGHTRAPVVIFLDEIDGIEPSDYAAELFKIVRACHDARAAEPEYRRLSFVLLGAALPSGTAAAAAVATTEISTRLDLPDFSFSEARPLAEGLELPSGDAERALYRILYWTGGHPYLTQKLCQAVARNARRIDSDEAVDRLVATRFLGRNVVTTETSMSRVLDALDRAGKLARPALRLYRRIHRGRRPKYHPENPEHELLRMCGLVDITPERRLVVRNRIYAEVFSHRWAREALPVEWGRVGRVAAVTALVLGTAWVYFEVLPRPYEETLRVFSVEMDEAVTAWSGMRRIPGFGARADRLLARVLIRRSRLAESWPAAEAIDVRLRALPGYAARADALLVEYWERRAAAAEAAERRGEALLYRLRAYEAGPTADAGLAAQLGSGDYQRLRTVIRPSGLVEAAAVAAGGRSVATISAGNILERWDAGTGLPERNPRLELLAEEFVAVRRRLSLDGEGRVSAPSVELLLDHPRPEDLRVVLSSPGGRSVELPVANADVRGDRLVLDERTAPGLRALRGEEVLGTWLLEIEDRWSGKIGFFGGWALNASPAHRAEDLPENALLLAPPNKSSAVRVALSPGAATVAALPRKPDARGRLQTWDVVSGRPLASIDVGTGERRVGFADDATLLLLQDDGSGRRLRVLDATTGEERLAYFSPDGFAAGPAVSADGRYVAAAEAVSRVAWIRELESGREVFRQPFAGEGVSIAVAPGGFQLALADRDGVVRVWHATDGALAAEFPHDAAVIRLAFDPSGRWLATVTASGQARVWDLLSPESGLVLHRPGGDPDQLGFDASGRLFVTLGQAHGYELWSLPEATPYGPVLRHGEIRMGTSGDFDHFAGPQRMLVGGDRLVGGRGTRSIRIWEAARGGAPAELPRIPSAVALAPSGLRMSAGTVDGRVVLRMRDTHTLQLGLSIITSSETRHGGGVTAMAFSPDGDRLASVGDDGSVVLWDAVTGEAIGSLFQHDSGRVEAIGLGRGGRLLVIAGELGARAWDAGTGTPGPAFGAGRAVSVIALDAEGLRAFTGTPEGEIESWDVDTGQRLWFGDMEGPASSIAVSEDGARVAAAGETGLVQAWGLGNARRPLNLALAAPVTGLQFAPDGETLLAQTASWIHRLGVVDDRLQVLGSRLLPAAVPPGAWRSATEEGTRIVLVGGASSESMLVLDFERAPLPPEDWEPDLAAWQQKLKLYFAEDGELHDGAAYEALPGPAEPVEELSPLM